MEIQGKVGVEAMYSSIFLLGLSFMGTPWVWVSPHSDLATRRNVWFNCAAAVDTVVILTYRKSVSHFFVYSHYF
jgi:hypothetical protein